MRVVHLIGGGDTGGAKTHVLNLLRELNKHIDAELVSFRRGEFSDEAEKMGIPIHIIETGNPFAGLKQLKKVLGDKKIDVIHCHGARGNLMGNLLKRHAKAPVLTTVHSDYRLDYLGRPAAKISYGTIYTLALRMVDFYIGVSDTMTNILIDRNFPAHKIYTIYNGIDFNIPLEPVCREEFFKSLNFTVNDGDVVAGIAARLSPVKDMPTLLKAMKIACEKAPNLKLVIAGDGEDKEKLEAMAKELGLTDKVCFAGWLKDINSFYNAIDINLLTSISETFPYALTEGTRMKKATIASRVGGVPALIDDGKNGFIFEPQNYEELAGYLVTLATNDEQRIRMGELLNKKASEHFSIDSMVQVQLDIYESVIKRFKRQKLKRDGIVVCGAYGYGNAGDDAILKSIINSVREIDRNMPITVLAKNTMNIKKSFRLDAIYSFNIFRMINRMRHSLLYINGGGSLIQNATSSRSLFYYLFTLRVAKIFGCKVDMYGCGIGPVNGERHIKRVRKTLNKYVDSITLRENFSLSELESYGVTKPKLSITSDPALVLKPDDAEQSAEFLRKNCIEPSGEYACFLLRAWVEYEEKATEIARAADYVYEKYGLTPVFIPINFVNDTKAARTVTEHMSTPHFVLDTKAEPEMIISALSHMKIAISMRLHGLIFASMSGKPIVGISYDPKVNSFIDYLGYGECINLSEMNAENLTSAIDHAVTQIPFADELCSHAKRLAQLEHGNIEAVSELLNL